MKNRDFLKDYSHLLTGDDVKDDQIIANLFDIYSSEKISIYFPEEQCKKVNFSPRGYYNAFFDKNWQKLDLVQKLRVVYWEQQDNLLKLGLKNPLPLKIFLRNDIVNTKYSAIAFKDKILYNLENLSKTKGLYAYTTIIHECQHLIDYKNYDKLITKYEAYINHSQNNKTAFENELMALPISGNLINKNTCEKIEITKEIANEILLLKNTFCALSNMAPVLNESSVSDSEYLNFCNQSFYYISPLEYRAFINSLEGLKLLSMICGNDLCTNNDFQCFKHNKKLGIMLRYKKQESLLKFGISYEDFMNTELIALYNNTIYGKNKNNYICQDIMQKREAIIVQTTNNKIK